MKAPAMAKKISFRSMVIVLVVGLILGVGLTLWVTKPFSATAAFDHQPKSRTSEVVNAVTREQQVVLLSLGIQGISQKSDSSTFFGPVKPRWAMTPASTPLKAPLPGPKGLAMQGSSR